MKFIEEQSAQKLRGGYYTPTDLAAFLAAWVREIAPSRVLEPSCGDGAFFHAMAEVGGFEDTEILGFELDDDEAEKAFRKASSVGLNEIEVRSEDFLGWAIDNLAEGGERFDAILGNPPFVRYQFLPSSFQTRASMSLKCRQQANMFSKRTARSMPAILPSVVEGKTDA